MALRSNWCIRNITSEEKRLGVDFKSTLRDHPEIPFLLNEGPLIWNPLLRTHFWGRRNHIMCWLKIILVAGLFSSSAFNLMTSLLSFLWQRKSKSDHQQLKKKIQVHGNVECLHEPSQMVLPEFPHQRGLEVNTTWNRSGLGEFVEKPQWFGKQVVCTQVLGYDTWLKVAIT